MPQMRFCRVADARGPTTPQAVTSGGGGDARFWRRGRTAVRAIAGLDGYRLDVAGVGRDEVERLLDLVALIDALARTLANLSTGEASLPTRVFATVRQDDVGLTGLLDMPAFEPATSALVSKLVSVFPENFGGARPVRQAVIVAFDVRDGRPEALMDGTFITAVRTAAVSALSARLLASVDAASLAILGTGAQAEAHARLVTRVRPIRSVWIAGRDHEKARLLAQRLDAELEPDVRPARSYEAAVAGPQIACATTFASEPVVRRDWLAPGTHVTSVGYNPNGRELDDGTITDSLLCVESREAALSAVPPNRDLSEPLKRGLITLERAPVELGELVDGPTADAPPQISSPLQGSWRRA